MPVNQFVTHPVATSAYIILAALIVGAAAGYGAAQIGTRSSSDIAATTRSFEVFSTVLPFDEDTVGVPHDAFVPSSMTVYKGDTVTIRFYNTEDVEEDHAFELVPYVARATVPAGTTFEKTFVADQAGTFAYKCDLHQPTMTGYLTVIG